MCVCLVAPPQHMRDWGINAGGWQGEAGGEMCHGGLGTPLPPFTTPLAPSAAFLCTFNPLYKFPGGCFLVFLSLQPLITLLVVAQQEEVKGRKYTLGAITFRPPL